MPLSTVDSVSVSGEKPLVEIGQTRSVSEVASVPQGGTLHVLTIQVIKDGISALKKQRIHEHFPAYLQLRKLAVTTKKRTGLHPDWHDVGEFLKMPGGPPTKPNYRPFSSRKRRDEAGYWYNPNLAGSYAPSSMRKTSGFMLNGDSYELPIDHAAQAFEQLLGRVKIPAWALASYYLRNYGFVFDGEGDHDELIAAFKSEFCFQQGTDFNLLFNDSPPDPEPASWFTLSAVPIRESDRGGGETDD